MERVMFRKILVPLDRSYFAEQALVDASVLARRSNAAIRLLVVHQPVPYAGFEDVPWYRDEAVAENEYLNTMLKELSSTGIAADAALLRGSPAKLICEEAERSGSDLIVMTSHGRTGLNRMWLGSVADGVLRHSTIPVLIIRPTDHKVPHAKAATEIKKILVTLDGSALSLKILPAVAELARCTDSEITLLSVVRPVPWVAPVTNMPFAFSPAAYDPEVTKELVAATEKELAITKEALEKTVPVVHTSVVIGGSVAHSIMECIETMKFDLVALSTHGRGASRFLLGSVADKIVRGTDVPVLICNPRVTKLDGDIDSAEAETTALAAV
jgi:nucleotide-binding universal stress UspA family protein